VEQMKAVVQVTLKEISENIKVRLGYYGNYDKVRRIT
jgi:hypothetical protein